MKLIPRADAERAMKVQEVILRAMAKSITWWQAAVLLHVVESAHVPLTFAAKPAWVRVPSFAIALDS
jgi:hypothetical protein